MSVRSPRTTEEAASLGIEAGSSIGTHAALLFGQLKGVRLEALMHIPPFWGLPGQKMSHRPMYSCQRKGIIHTSTIVSPEEHGRILFRDISCTVWAPQ